MYNHIHIGKDLSSVQRLIKRHQVIQGEINTHESRIEAVCSAGEAMIVQDHYGRRDIENKIKDLKEKWSSLRVCYCCTTVLRNYLEGLHKKYIYIYFII